MMNAKVRTAALVALLVVVTSGAGHGLLSGQETHTISGSDVAVYNLAGTVRVVAGSGSDVVVRLTRGGEDAARLDVQVSEVRGRQALRVIYPGDRVVYPEMGRRSHTQTRVRSDGTFGDGRGRGGDRVDIRGSGRGLEAWADLVVEVPAGKRFALYLAVGNGEVRGVEGDFLVDMGSGSVGAQDVTGSLKVDTGSGSVDVQNIRGDVTVDTGSGGVTVRSIEGGSLIVDTGSGGVRGGDVTADEVRVDTGSGSIELEKVSSPDVYLDTGSGSVEVELLRDVDHLDVDTGSGSVTIRAPEDLGAEADIETGSGGIDLDFPVQVRSVRRDHIVGTIGDGRGTLRIDTGSGTIRIIR